jgi:hypothetical protein
MARPDRLLARAFADSCVLFVNLLEKQGDQVFAHY